jgi:hypothetical protein
VKYGKRNISVLGSLLGRLKLALPGTFTTEPVRLHTQFPQRPIPRGVDDTPTNSAGLGATPFNIAV